MADDSAEAAREFKRKWSGEEWKTEYESALAALLSTFARERVLAEHDNYCRHCRHRSDEMGGKGRCERGKQIEGEQL